MSAEQLEELAASRAELAALRVTLRREYADLTLAAREAVTEDAPAPQPLLYTLHNVREADRALTTALAALAELLEAGRVER